MSMFPNINRRAKYGNRKVTVDGLTFDSAKEARRWGGLKLLERAGEITDLRRQVRYPIVWNGVKVCAYVADFVYVLDGVEIVEDVKGFKTAMYRLKKKLMKACHGVEIHEV